MRYEERPPSRWQRALVLVGAWAVGVPFFWMLFLIMGWWALIVLVPALWASWDYLKKGGFFESVDSVTKAGKFLPDAFDDR